MFFSRPVYTAQCKLSTARYTANSRLDWVDNTHCPRKSLLLARGVICHIPLLQAGFSWWDRIIQGTLHRLLAPRAHFKDCTRYITAVLGLFLGSWQDHTRENTPLASFSSSLARLQRRHFIVFSSLSSRQEYTRRKVWTTMVFEAFLLGKGGGWEYQCIHIEQNFFSYFLSIQRTNRCILAAITFCESLKATAAKIPLSVNCMLWK